MASPTDPARGGHPPQRWLLPAAIALATTACRSPAPMIDDASAAPPPTAPAQPALGPGLEAAPVMPGRYALAIQRTLHGTHALHVLAEDSTTTLIVELGADGSATACRGWRYRFRNSGPQVKTEDRYRERMGYRGRFTAAAGAVELILSRDDTVCAHHFEGALALERRPQLKLRCIGAKPTGAGPLAGAGPLLACRSVGDPPSELRPLAAPGVAADGWIVLGAGDGLRLRVTGRPPGARAGDPVKVEALPAGEPIDRETWTRSF